MTETTLYERLLGIEHPWRVRDVRLALEQGDVEIGVEFVGETLVCPACGAACPGYDRRPRRWRHLDTMQYRTLVRAEVPRVRCAEHGVQLVQVPWADARARFTALFEAMVIDWLQVASFAAVTRQCRLSWDQVSGIQERAVQRGLSRRAVAAAPLVGVDETSFQRRHEYVTVVNDLTTAEPCVLYVADGRDHGALDGYFKDVGAAGCALIAMVAMDMWPAYIRSVREHTDALIDAVLTNVTNARSEATNAKIQWIKRLACGYRNRKRFRNAIYFHLGGLDLYPDALAAHTNS